MSYKEKAKKKQLLRSSLSKLGNFALDEPKLSVNNRRAIVAAIYLGGGTGCSATNELLPNKAYQSHQFTQNGLMEAFSEKLTSPNPDLADAIMKVSSLSAWAYANPNQCEDIIDSFVIRMVPEDKPEMSAKPIDSVMSALRSDWGITKTFELVVLPPEVWKRKYYQR